jgi:hypothetical protein
MPHQYQCNPITNITGARSGFIDPINDQIERLTNVNYTRWHTWHLMAPRFDMHGVAVNILRKHSDCTHYIFSPLFWEGLLHTLVGLLQRGEHPFVSS